MDRIKLVTLIVLHLLIVVINKLALLVLLTTPYYFWLLNPSIYSVIMGICISIPLLTFLGRLALLPPNCPLTNWENTLRKRLGYKPIDGFFFHYFYDWRTKHEAHLSKPTQLNRVITTPKVEKGGGPNLRDLARLDKMSRD